MKNLDIHRIVLLLHNIRSVYNVGAILRTAEGLGIDRVAYSGYTPRYRDPELLPHLRAKLDHKIAKVALGAENIVAQEYVGDARAWLTEKRGEGWALVGLENNLAPEEEARKVILGRAWPRRVGDTVLVLGEEVDGIPAELRTELDYFLEIPMYGRKESFNVSVAAGIALWGLRDYEARSGMPD